MARLAALTWAPSVPGNGADPPVGCFRLVVAFQGPAAEIDLSVMHPAQQAHVVDVCRTSVGPRGDVVRLAFSGGSSTQKTTTVSDCESDALGRGSESVRASHGKWLAAGVDQCLADGSAGTVLIVEQDRRP